MMMTLKQLYPATTFKEVSRTTVPGIFEVVMGQNIAYVDQSGTLLLFWSIVRHAEAAGHDGFKA
jgi:thiol:disulfide interchange protein DsbC